MYANDFHKLASSSLDNLANALDELDSDGIIEVEYQNDIITITTQQKKQFIVNKHSPSNQIWLSSPISGGLHFSYNGTDKNWQTVDGKVLEQVLKHDLKISANIEVLF